MKHTDIVVIGEAESIWKDLLKGLSNNTLKKVYKGERLPLHLVPSPQLILKEVQRVKIMI